MALLGLLTKTGLRANKVSLLMSQVYKFRLGRLVCTPLFGVQSLALFTGV